jgi:hypothetical protein
MAKLTKIQALTKTIQVWTFIAHGKGDKTEAMYELFPGESPAWDCFLCEKAPRNAYHITDCTKCLVWGPLKRRCYDNGQAYSQYLCGDVRNAALEIVRLSQEALKRVRAEAAEKRRTAKLAKIAREEKTRRSKG